MNIKVRVKVLEGGTPPIKMTYGSAGYDCYARYMRREGDYVTYGLGFAIEIPDGYVGILAMRSSVYLTGMTFPNAIGIIDSDFRGELTAKFLASPDAHPYEAGERVCQLLILPALDVSFVESEHLSATERGWGGYGSTGND